MARRGPSEATRRRRTSEGASRRRSNVARPKEEKSWFRGGGNDLDPLYFLASPFSPLIKKYGGKPGRVAADALTAFGFAPAAVATRPKASVEDVGEMFRGAFEAAPAIYRSVRDQGAGDTGAMLLAAIGEDYKTRYGANWKQHAKEDPLFNFLDVFAVFGGATRGAALGSAFSRLGQAGVRQTPKSVWKESSRPGLLSEGMARGRELTYDLQTGKPETVTQPYSRSPTRRVFQNLADELADRYPTMPLMGARSRVARASSRETIRDTERLMGQVTDPHAVQALPRELRTRLFWGAQIGDHSTAALKEFRNLLKDTFDSGELPDDPQFRQTVLEARKRGFGKQMIRRLDEAIEVEPGDSPRYAAAIQSMRDMTALSERTIKDADGFQGLTGDLKRAT